MKGIQTCQAATGQGEHRFSMLICHVTGKMVCGEENCHSQPCTPSQDRSSQEGVEDLEDRDVAGNLPPSIPSAGPTQPRCLCSSSALHVSVTFFLLRISLFSFEFFVFPSFPLTYPSSSPHTLFLLSSAPLFNLLLQGPQAYGNCSSPNGLQVSGCLTMNRPSSEQHRESVLYQEGVRGGPWQGRRSPSHRTLGSEDTKTEDKWGLRTGGRQQEWEPGGEAEVSIYRPVTLRTGPWHRTRGYFCHLEEALWRKTLGRTCTQRSRLM